MPDMQYVDSTNIEAIGYDASNQQLHIRFLKSGETYVYYNVEEWVFVELMQSDSKGKYLSANIRQNYQFGRL
jgi:hypothetical protein